MKKKIFIVLIILLLVTTATIFATEVSEIEGLGDPVAPLKKFGMFLRGTLPRILGGLAFFGLAVSLWIEGSWTKQHKKTTITIMIALVLMFGGPAITDWLSSDFEKGLLVKENVKVLFWEQ